MKDTMALTNIEKLIAKAVKDYHLIEEGDRILLGASGGKDSTVLAWALSRRKIWKNPPFELAALRIAGDVPGGGMSSSEEQSLKLLFDEWQIPLDTVNVSIMGSVKEGRSMNCYWCSTIRRSELIDYAIKHNFNKIALGHHLDDILTTLLMNMTKKGEIATMIPKLKYEKYPLTIIRPLALVMEQSIKDFIISMGWKAGTCSCDYGANGERKEYQKKLDNLTNGKEEAKRLLFRSMSNIRSEYLS
jgi:tRNA(Ile)-lysidine synthase TilS/MesJ